MSQPFYAAEQVDDHGIPTVRLTDAHHAVEVSIVPSIGNRAYRMLVRGENILHFPFDNPSALKGDTHLNGIPFLAPWANRMPDGFHANGKYYRFNPESETIRPDQNGIPIHGMLTASPFWEVVDVSADADSASVTSRLDRLSGGTLDVSVTVTNRTTDPMPIAVGFHPYFQLPGVPIEDAVARLPVRRHVETDARLVATGETTPVTFGEQVALKDHRFDDGFTDLVRGADGRAVFSVEGRGKKIEVSFGPHYQVGVVYAPPGRNFICFEPMTAITNGINLAFEGKYPELQTVPAGGQWHESFRIQSF
jgi:aldose 1-epimerase